MVEFFVSPVFRRNCRLKGFFYPSGQRTDYRCNAKQKHPYPSKISFNGLPDIRHDCLTNERIFRFAIKIAIYFYMSHFFSLETYILILEGFLFVLFSIVSLATYFFYHNSQPLQSLYLDVFVTNQIIPYNEIEININADSFAVELFIRFAQISTRKVITI